METTYKVDLKRDLIPPRLLLATINGLLVSIQFKIVKFL